MRYGAWWRPNDAEGIANFNNEPTDKTTGVYQAYAAFAGLPKGATNHWDYDMSITEGKERKCFAKLFFTAYEKVSATEFKQKRTYVAIIIATDELSSLKDIIAGLSDAAVAGIVIGVVLLVLLVVGYIFREAVKALCSICSRNSDGDGVVHNAGPAQVNDDGGYNVAQTYPAAGGNYGQPQNFGQAPIGRRGTGGGTLIS